MWVTGIADMTPVKQGDLLPLLPRGPSATSSSWMVPHLYLGTRLSVTSGEGSPAPSTSKSLGPTGPFNRLASAPHFLSLCLVVSVTPPPPHPRIPATVHLRLCSACLILFHSCDPSPSCPTATSSSLKDTWLPSSLCGTLRCFSLPAGEERISCPSIRYPPGALLPLHSAPGVLGPCPQLSRLCTLASAVPSVTTLFLFAVTIEIPPSFQA